MRVWFSLEGPLRDKDTVSALSGHTVETGGGGDLRKYALCLDDLSLDITHVGL